jgi:fructose-1-phosphate kinase PfkB-like protein
LLRSTAFHFLAAPEKLTAFVSELFNLRDADQTLPRPLIVWEPVPFSCVLASQNAHLEAARLVNVYSPNHTELLSTFTSSWQTRSSSLAPLFDRKAIEEGVFRILSSGVGKDGDGAVVVRCAEHGCLVASRSYPAKWFPAYYGSTSSQVVDPTGAGNAFLGALTLGLGEGTSIDEAVIMGVVAASFAIEQIGLPSSDFSGPNEMWNGEGFLARIKKYRAILS